MYIMVGVRRGLFNSFWSVEKHDANPTTWARLDWWNQCNLCKSVAKIYISHGWKLITQIKGINGFVDQ